MTVFERIEAGKRWLINRYGNLWFKRIDLGNFDMGNSCRCIIGQLEGDFFKVFNVEECCDNANCDAGLLGFYSPLTHRELNELWEAEIRMMKKNYAQEISL